MNIAGLTNIKNPALDQLQKQVGNAAVKDGKSDDFADMLMDVLKEVNDSQANAKQVGNNFQTGQQGVDYHDLMIAMERASVAMNLTIQVRNKLLDAYQEISRMQV
jgi:flagellar hook-basal body complex protein FliE